MKGGFSDDQDLFVIQQRTKPQLKKKIKLDLFFFVDDYLLQFGKIIILFQQSHEIFCRARNNGEDIFL